MFTPSEPIAAFTHLAGALVCVGAAPSLIARGLTQHARVALAVFAASAVLLLLASGAFHSMPPDSPSREVFRRLDHAAIFLLIAGSFTPIHAVLFRGWLRSGILVPIWTAAIAGVAFKTLFIDAIPYWVGVLVYVVMGWTGGVSFAFLIARRGLRYASPLLLGGVAYTVGAVCEFTNQPSLIPGVFASHEVFHIMVLLGLMGMWAFMHRAVDDDPEATKLTRAERSTAAEPIAINTTTDAATADNT